MRRKSLENTMDELISVILPVYNGQEYLPQAIESILHQSYQKLEFIIINDGSKDKSIDIINEYASKDSRIKVIDRHNMGLIVTLNEAIEKASGNLIARMDQDDIALPQRLQLQYDYMVKNSLDVCGGNFITIDKDNKILQEHTVPQTEAEIIITMATNVPFAHPSVMMQKSFLTKNNLTYGLHGYRNGEDLDLWMLMYNYNAKFGNVNNTILHYRVLSSSMSRTNHKNIKKEANTQFNNFIQKNILNFENAFHAILKQKDLTNEMQKNIIRAILRYSFIKHDLTLVLKCFLKVNISNALIGTLSFIKLKFT